MRVLVPPLDAHQLRPLEPECEVVQTCHKLIDSELVHLAELLRDRPDVKLRFYYSFDSEEEYTDLQFLRFFPFVEKLSIDLRKLENYEGLALANPKLVSLTLDCHWGKKLSVRPAERFKHLERFWVLGPAKDIDVVSAFSSLKEFGTASVALPDFSIIPESVEHFTMKTGSAKTLNGMERLKRLKFLWLAMPYGLADVTAVSELESLERLFFDCLARIEEMPDCSRLKKLRSATVLAKRLQRLDGLAAAPALEEMAIVNCPALTADSFRCFVGHPTLKAANIFFGKAAENERAVRMLGLPRFTRGAINSEDSPGSPE